MRIYNPEDYSYVTVIEIPKNEISKFDMALCAQPRQTLKSYYDSCAVKPTLLLNGGFFNMADGTTCFNYINNGQVVNTTSSYKEGFGVINGELKYGLVGEEPFEDFISAYPVLIAEGRDFNTTVGSELNYKGRRTVLAYDKENIYVIAVEKPGMNYPQLRQFLRSLKVDYAINLDGGGSTKILKDGQSITSIAYNRAVDNVIAIYLNPQIIYRVQMGCFKTKKNADSFLAQIQELPDTIGTGYKNAYIRKIEGYYKIQVGAFSVKANAVKVVNDIKSKGYDAFITTA